MIELDVQQAIYEKLSDSVPLMELVAGIYDDVPQADDSGAGASFPYITVGDDSAVEWDTDTELGAEVTITVHTWSRYAGKSELKEIQAQIYQVLHRATLDFECYNCVGIDFVSSDSFLDPDGKTRHGTQTFRLTLEEN